MGRITFRVYRGGKVVIETDGFAGGTCMDATKRFRDRLGRTLTVEKKADFYQETIIPIEQLVKVNGESDE